MKQFNLYDPKNTWSQLELDTQKELQNKTDDLTRMFQIIIHITLTIVLKKIAQYQICWLNVVF